jgi:hypothetical protein
LLPTEAVNIGLSICNLPVKKCRPVPWAGSTFGSILEPALTIKRSSIGRDQDWPLVATKVVGHHHALELIRYDQVTAGSLKVSREEKMGVRYDQLMVAGISGIKIESGWNSFDK